MKANTRIRKQIPLFGPKKHYFHEVSIPHQYCHYRSSHSLFSDSISQTKHVSVFTHHQTLHKPPGEPCAPIRTILVVGFREHADSSSGSDPKLFKINRMESDKYAKELDVAVRVVHMACSMCQSVQKGLVSGSSNQVKSKYDDSPVTVADWSVQATVSWILSESFGSQNVSIIAEEDVQTLSEADSVGLLEMVVTTVNKTLAKAPNFGLNGPGQALEAPQVLEAINRCNSTGGPVGKHWVLDPVDGTLGFLRGDQYAVALALIDDGQVVIGVLGCPNYPTKKESLHNRKKPDGYISSPDSSEKGCVMYTRRGSGEAWMHPLIHGDEKFDWSNLAKLIRVSSIDDPALATFCEPVEETNSDHSFTAKLANNVGLSNKPLRVYSMVKYAAIARGDAEIYMKFARAGYKEKIWDHAAGVLIVEEAGGVVTDAGGRPLNFSRGMYLEGLDRGIVACSGVKLHKKFIGAIYASWDSSNL